jgi:hypothetical protein
MGNGTSSEPERLIPSNDSPLLPMDAFKQQLYRSHLLHHVPIATIVDIMMEYYEPPQQHLIAISNMDHDGSSSYSIGWISSHLSPRPTMKLLIGKANDTNMYRDVNDHDGYRRIYGTFPSEWLGVNSQSIINDRSYLFGTHRVNNQPLENKHDVVPIQAMLTIASCSVADLLASSLSTVVPISSFNEASSLIHWKLDHAAVPSYVWRPSNGVSGEPVPSCMYTCVWRKRLVILTSFSYSPARLQRQQTLQCCYYDTITNEWHELPELLAPVTIPLYTSHEPEVKTLDDRVYVSFPQLPTSFVEKQALVIKVYNERTNQWDQLPNAGPPQCELILHLLPHCPLPLTSSSSAAAGSSNNISASNETINNCLTIITAVKRERYAHYHHYNIANGSSIRQRRWPTIKWISGVSKPVVMNNEWLIWPAFEEERIPFGVPPKNFIHKRIGIVHMNDIYDKKKWRWWPSIPFRDFRARRSLIISDCDSCTDYQVPPLSVDSFDPRQPGRVGIV